MVSNDVSYESQEPFTEHCNDHASHLILNFWEFVWKSLFSARSAYCNLNIVSQFGTASSFAEYESWQMVSFVTEQLNTGHFQLITRDKNLEGITAGRKRIK